MLGNLINDFKHPVSRIIKKSQTETGKNGIFRCLLFSAILSLLNIFDLIVSIMYKYSKRSEYYSNFTYSKIWSERFEVFKNSHLLINFLKGWLSFAILIVIISIILFLIAKLLNSKFNFKRALSIANNITVPYILIAFVAIILGLIYSPIKLFLIFFAAVFSVSTLIISYKSCLEINKDDSFVLASSLVTTCIALIVIIFITLLNKISIAYTSSLLELLSLFRIY